VSNVKSSTPIPTFSQVARPTGALSRSEQRRRPRLKCPPSVSAPSIRSLARNSTTPGRDSSYGRHPKPISPFQQQKENLKAVTFLNCNCISPESRGRRSIEETEFSFLLERAYFGRQPPILCNPVIRYAHALNIASSIESPHSRNDEFFPSLCLLPIFA
jgi:hypothetical protein